MSTRLEGLPLWIPKSNERSPAREVVPHTQKARHMSGLARKPASPAERAAKRVTAADERRKVSPKPNDAFC